MKSLEVKQTRWIRTCVWLPSLVIYCRPRILLCWDNPGLCSSFSHTVPPPPPLWLTVIRFHAEREKKREEERRVRKTGGKKRRSAGLCPGFVFFFSRVAVLSLQRHLSAAVCVAQWLIKHVPVTQDSSSLQTNTPTHTFGHLFPSSPYSPPPSFAHHPPAPFPSVSFRWLDGLCGAVGLTVLSWCEPNPSGTQYPVYQLSALWKTTTILSRGRSSELITVCSGHSQGRSLLRYSTAVSSESRLCYCCRFLFFASSPFPNLYMFLCHALWANLPAATSRSSRCAGPLDNWPSSRKNTKGAV